MQCLWWKLYLMNITFSINSNHVSFDQQTLATKRYCTYATIHVYKYIYNICFDKCANYSCDRMTFVNIFLKTLLRKFYDLYTFSF